MTAKTDLPPIPSALADVALIDGPTCAASAGLSLSSWHELVRAGIAPAPVIRQPRYTRWSMAAVRGFLIEHAARQLGEASEAVTARAKKASVAAQAKRAGASMSAGQ